MSWALVKDLILTVVVSIAVLLLVSQFGTIGMVETAIWLGLSVLAIALVVRRRLGLTRAKTSPAPEAPDTPDAAGTAVT